MATLFEWMNERRGVHFPFPFFLQFGSCQRARWMCTKEYTLYNMKTISFSSPTTYYLLSKLDEKTFLPIVFPTLGFVTISIHSLLHCDQIIFPLFESRYSTLHKCKPLLENIQVSILLLFQTNEFYVTGLLNNHALEY